MGIIIPVHVNDPGLDIARGAHIATVAGILTVGFGSHAWGLTQVNPAVEEAEANAKNAHNTHQVDPAKADMANGAHQVKPAKADMANGMGKA